MDNLAQIKCQTLPGVGPKIAHYLSKCGIYTLQDLLFHLPHRYENRSQITAIKDAKPGSPVLIKGIIQANKPYKRKGRAYQLDDGTGSLTLRLFHLTPQHQQQLQAGVCLLCFGEIRTSFKKFFAREIIHPEIQCLPADTDLILPDHLTGVYPSTQGLAQRSWQKLIEQLFVLLGLSTHHQSLPKTKLIFTDLLPPILLKPNKLPTLLSAFYYLHRPPTDAPLHELALGKHGTQQRLILEELLAHTLNLRVMKEKRTQETAYALKPPQRLIKRFLASLPFKLTAAQQHVIQEISHDMEKPYPMQRLLQGDVGSGKTVVAAVAALQAIENHYQVALMAPTELLSEQHQQQFHHWLTPLDCHVVCLKSKLKTKAKQQILSAIENGTAQIVIGTHAIFQENVKFANLGLSIIDEQHRFGVQQRLALWKKGQNKELQAHQLFMTATPIPRTLAMTALSNLDISFLDELPAGRLAVKTIVLSAQQRMRVIERIRDNCLQKRQAYWVCPLIAESDLLHYTAAETTLKKLQTHLPDLRLGLIHGRLTAESKENIMRQFKAGDIDLLIATTVIEVGLDVSNANLMIIENAERLGLAQLHQLRGRVGRSTLQSYCVLLYENLSPIAKKRLAIMRQSNNGFVIAQQDLALRGPGEVCGLRQTGWQQLRIADLDRDYYLLPKVQRLADKIGQDYPDLIEPIIQRWIKNNYAHCSKV
jgi:ATP-dependent DNA helicase RecG